MAANEIADVLGPCLLVAVLAALWALTEVVQAFRSDIRRALRSGWSGLLMGINGGLALLVK